MMADGAVARRADGWRGVVVDYYELTKPRIIGLLLLTTVAAMIMAAKGLPPPLLTLWTIVGGALAAASAGTFNCVIDRDIDAVMRRTMGRPLPAGRIEPGHALVYAIALGLASFAVLELLVNPLAAWLSVAGNLFYVVVYTLWLKRTTTMNIVIGGAAGAVPPLVGWAAVTHAVGAPAIALFALVFLWTPPHFWALALMIETDYAKAKVPMLPNVHGVVRTTREIVGYSIVMVVASLALFPLHVMGAWYAGSAALLGGIFLFGAVRLNGEPTRAHARALFRFSLIYLALMCCAMVGDRLLS